MQNSPFESADEFRLMTNAIEKRCEDLEKRVKLLMECVTELMKNANRVQDSLRNI